MNTTATVLEKLKELSSPTRGQFKIEASDIYSGYYTISIGKHSFITQYFTEETLFDALVCIRTCIAVEEGWYK